MFTADVPGIARSASGEMARTAESRLCRERSDQGSGRRDLVFVDREVAYVVDAKGRRRALAPEVAALVPHGVLTTRELVPPRRGVALRDLGALRDRFRGR